MRLLSALFVSAALLAPAAHAADITQQGAQDLERKFKAYLPENLAKSDLIKVRPGTQDYEVTLDPSVLLKDTDSKTFSISGLKPFLSLLRPIEDGLWHLSQNNNLDVKGYFFTGTEKTDFTYKIASIRTDGVVDPDLLYFKSAEMSADGLSVTTTSQSQSIDANFKSMKSTSTSKRATPTTVDIRSNTAMGTFLETITDPAMSKVAISADTLTGDVALNGLTYKPLQEIIFFLLDRVKKTTLTPEEQTKLKELARSNMPLFETLLESIDVNNIKVATPNGQFGAKGLRYTISSNGLRDNAKFGVGLTVEKPFVPQGLVPDAFLVALPDTVNTNVSFENINIASGITYFLDHADFNADKTLTDAQSSEIGRIFLPGGALTIRYDDVSAQSSIYDFSISGSTIVYPDQPERQNTDVTLYARDFDKTIEFLQANAQTVPQFGQAAFGMQMIKGFAKQAPDGRQMWNIVVGEDRKVKINGQDLPFQP